MHYYTFWSVIVNTLHFCMLIAAYLFSHFDYQAFAEACSFLYFFGIIIVVWYDMVHKTWGYLVAAIPTVIFVASVYIIQGGVAVKGAAIGSFDLCLLIVFILHSLSLSLLIIGIPIIMFKMLCWGNSDGDNDDANALNWTPFIPEVSIDL